MKTSTHLISCVSFAAASLLGSSMASAAFLSQVNLYSTIFDTPANTTVGGFDIPTAEFSRTATVNPAAGITQTVSGWSLASAQTGRLAFRMTSEVNLTPDAAISSSLTAAIQSTNNTVISDFTIGAGGGLVDGQEAFVSLQVLLDVDYQLQGRPSSGMQFDFSVRAGEGVNLTKLINFNTGGIVPPASAQFSQFWNILVPVTVGGDMRVDTAMSGWLGGTAFDRGETGINHLFADPIFRITNAPGYDLNIISHAGASTSPIVPVPPAVWLFGSGLIGLIVIARRKKL